jgi:hypothetical protein
LTVFFGLVLASTPLASRAADASQRENKTHTLFMGMDFDVKQGTKFERVTDVVGGSFILRAEGKIVRVPVDGEVGLRVTQGLKLASVSVGIKELKVERAYTPANDPRRKWTEAMNGMSDGATHGVQSAQRSLSYAQGVANEADRAASAADPRSGAAMAGYVASTHAAVGSAQQSVGNAVQMSGTLSNSAFYIQKMEEELKQELFDAVEMNFELSSAQPLANPYVVVVVQFHAPDAPKGAAQNWIYAEAMERLDAQPKKFHVKRGGLPRGYILEHYQVHVYDRGREVASTVAPERVDLTSDEAYDYLFIQHMAAHKGKNTPAVVALGNLPLDVRQKLPPRDLSQTFYAKVDKEGRAEGVFTDEFCTESVEENDTAAAIRNMRFLPALEKGAAVGGVARVKLADVSL